MKPFILLALFGAVVFSGCSDVADASPDATVNYRSPINLSYANMTSFETITYGTNGTTILSRDTVTLLVERSPYTDSVTKEPLWFYHWKDNLQGFIITFHQKQASTSSGVFVAGTYNQTDTTLFESPKLWLPFPADTGISGEPITTDSCSIQTMAELDFKISGSQGFYSTICYRSGSESEETYSYFELNQGLSAQLIYKKGVRFQSLLKI